MTDWLDTKTAVLVIATAVTAACVVAALGLGIALYLGPKLRLKRRIATLGVAAAPAGGGNPMRAINPGQRRIQERLQELKEQGKKRRRRDQIRGALLRAGLEPNRQIYLYLALAAGLVGAVGYLATGNTPIGALPAAVVAALVLPRVGLALVAKRRQKAFTRHFAEAIDIIVRGIRSGLPVGECFAIIAREMPDPVGSEFNMIVEGQRIGLPIEDVLRRGLERVPTPEFKFFAVVVQIQQQTGGNLADTLENLSGMLRERKQAREKVVALSSEAKASATIIGSIPFVLAGGLMVVDPNYLRPFVDEPVGTMILLAILAVMAVGIAWMRKMINFEI